MTKSHALTLLPALVLAACSSAPPTGSSSASASSAPQSGQGVTSSNGLTGSPSAGTGAAACAPLPPTPFANAVCVCEGLAEAGLLRTHASAPGAASVGVDGQFSAATGTSIEGSLSAYAGLAVAGSLDVRDAVSSTGNVEGVGALQVGDDLSVGGSFELVGGLKVGGALRLAQPGVIVPGAQVGSTAPYVAPAGPPCACDPSSLLPIASTVSAAASSNDNAAHGLGTTGADLVGAGDLTLSAGRYYFKDVTRVGTGQITIDGAVALFIDGSIDEVGANQIVINSGASLDLYVSGVIASAGSVALGDPTHPDAFRLFIGGAGSMSATAGDQTWSGLVYAPQANIAFAGVTKLDGALFAKSLDWAGVLDVTYDGATASTPCAPTPPASDAGVASSSPPSPPSDAGQAPASPPQNSGPTPK